MTITDDNERKGKPEFCNLNYYLDELLSIRSITVPNTVGYARIQSDSWAGVTYQNLPFPRGVLGLEPYFQDPPYRIALVDLGGLSGLNFSKFARKINTLQKTFHFGVASPPVTDLGIKNELHGYSYEQLFSAIKSHLEGTDYRFGVGIIHERLGEDAFNHHSIDLRVGIITIRDYEEYIPLGRSKEQYLAFLLLCESLCLVGGVDFEHPEERNCLFDYCKEKPHFRQCIESGKIDKFCQARLIREGGFKPLEVLDTKKILDYSARANLRELARGLLNNSITGFFIGGLAVNLLSNYIYDMPEPWPTIVTIFLIIGLFFSILIPTLIRHFNRGRFGYRVI